MANPRLDRIDLKILVQLQRNGRMSNVLLSDAVGLSASPCLLRVKRLEKAGFITGGYDYLLKFVTRGVGHYQEIIEEMLKREIGIAKYFSYIVLKSPISKPYQPLGALFEARR
jgi:DNA-binding Lrp family transcriptional regulator